ncbi:MAG TPA: Hsp20/alpha crystallin family protein [Thermoleophilaceae bacterium]|jgi:HSP20 family protein|nr:Hsp20/alpha crystallin family protein [Thermoleophilaceae bacterium]
MPERQGNPFEGVTDFFSELKRMRQIGTHGYESSHEERDRTHATAWVPATDIFSRNGDLVIRIEVAGQRPEDVDITFSQGVLTVSGVRRTEEDTGGDDSFYIRERFHGAFRRAITLPPGIDEDQIRAEFFNGLVEITVRDCAGSGETRRISLTDRSTETETRSLG